LIQTPDPNAISAIFPERDIIVQIQNLAWSTLSQSENFETSLCTIVLIFCFNSKLSLFGKKSEVTGFLK
jgi:hypothetical protein